tara:strand:+ start:73 stop:468 length:396 start_codon:yes stop_codon:yes gene_type:complete
MVQDLFRHLRTNAKPVGEMNSLDARQQLMVILMEECGELIQECSKNLRRGELFDREDFKNEVGDVYTMIDLLHEWDVISWDEIEKRREVKRKKLSKWSDLINETDLEEDRLRKGYEAGIDWDNGDGGELYE